MAQVHNYNFYVEAITAFKYLLITNVLNNTVFYIIGLYLDKQHVLILF